VRLCDGAVEMRIKTRGALTAREWATGFLRDKVWGGEKLTVMVNQILELAALPPIEPRTAVKNGGEGRARRTGTRGTNARTPI